MLGFAAERCGTDVPAGTSSADPRRVRPHRTGSRTWKTPRHAEGNRHRGVPERGVQLLHAPGGALAATLGLWLLLARTDDPVASAAYAIYGGTMVFMFATSALHHVTHAEEGVFRRLDMSAIYLFIAGTYTPFCLLALPRAWGVPMLVVVWACALVGVALRWALPATPRWISVSLYLGLGWMGIVGFWPLFQAFGWMPVALIVAGGAAYSLGAMIYARGRPDPWPRHVGHHGLWHVFVLVGAGIHFALVWALL